MKNLFCYIWGSLMPIYGADLRFLRMVEESLDRLPVE